MKYFLLFLIIAGVVIYKKKQQTNATSKGINKEQENQRIEIQKQPEESIIDSYQAKYLLTKNEWYEWKKLKEYAETKGLQICPKVRLIDIIEPRNGSQNHQSLMNRIQSKHVDFVICDQSMHIQAIVELDDNSHNRPERQQRDDFVDSILTKAGYKVIRTRSITEDTLKGL